METWSTKEAIAQAGDRLEAAIPGWRSPLAHGVALIPAEAQSIAPEHFPRVNGAGHRLVALVLADVVGHANGTAAYTLTAAKLELAIERLSPAEAYTGNAHPNLWAWRDDYLPALRGEPAARAVAVFLGEDAAAVGEDPAVAAFREAYRRQNA